MKNRKMKEDYNTHEAYLKHHRELLFDVCGVFTMQSSAVCSFECQRLVRSAQCRNHFAESKARLNNSREREQKKYDRRRFCTAPRLYTALVESRASHERTSLTIHATQLFFFKKKMKDKINTSINKQHRIVYLLTVEMNKENLFISHGVELMIGMTR